MDLNHIGPVGSRTLAEAFRAGLCAALQELHLGSVRASAHSFAILGQ